MIKNPPANEGDMGSILGLGRSFGEGNDNPLQYSYLENPMDGGSPIHSIQSIHICVTIYIYIWASLEATVRGIVKSRTRLSNFTEETVVLGS